MEHIEAREEAEREWILEKQQPKDRVQDVHEEVSGPKIHIQKPVIGDMFEKQVVFQIQKKIL